MGQPMQQQFPILLSTMNDVPGFRVARVMGEVFGLTVRSRNAFSNMGAGFKAMAGGELKGLSKLLYESRQEALQRLCQEGLSKGANAIVAMRFDCNEIGGTASEIAAYGTAVFLVPDGAPQGGQPQQQGYGQQPGTGQQPAFGQQQQAGQYGAPQG